jgi:cell division protein FtsL
MLKKILLIFLTIFGVFFYVWQKYASTSANYDLQKLYKQKQDLEQTKKELILKREELISPERIKGLAEVNFGLHELKESEMRIVKVNRADS